MNKYGKRLLKLEDFLHALPRKKFDYSRWVGDEFKTGDNLRTCGTTACALGWATTIPAFRRLGLCMWEDLDGVNSPGTSCGGDSSFAVEKVFDLNYQEYELLFIPGANEYEGLDHNATPKQVARHIRKFVKTKYGVAS